MHMWAEESHINVSVQPQRKHVGETRFYLQTHGRPRPLLGNMALRSKLHSTIQRESVMASKLREEAQKVKSQAVPETARGYHYPP